MTPKIRKSGLSGDCLGTTVTCALAEIYTETLDKIKYGGEEQEQVNIFGLLGIIYPLLFIVNFLSALLHCFISRQREYRADAIAVRLMRNPLSLAEALKLISRNWRGSGAQGERIESVFIMNPRDSLMDERENIFSDLFSTHPPVEKRINILLDMAHLDSKSLDEKLKNFTRISPIAGSEFKIPEPSAPEKWFIFMEQNWQGPFSYGGLKKLKGLKPDQWVKTTGTEKIKMLYDYPELMNIFGQDIIAAKQHNCPNCRTELQEIIHEGTPILKCRFCNGVFVEKEKINRILIRNDKEISGESLYLAQSIIQSKKHLFLRPSGSKSIWEISCPKCGQLMHREFFQYSYPVEIDRCINCSGIWFDKNELEILQYLSKPR